MKSFLIMLVEEIAINNRTAVYMTPRDSLALMRQKEFELLLRERETKYTSIPRKTQIDGKSGYVKFLSADIMGCSTDHTGMLILEDPWLMNNQAADEALAIPAYGVDGAYPPVTIIFGTGLLLPKKR